MKQLMFTALMLSTFSAYANEPLQTVSVSVDIGSCINADMMGDVSGEDEWELSIIPLDNNGKEIISQSQKVDVEAAPCYVESISTYSKNRYKGPELQVSANLKPGQLFKVQVKEKDWGIHWLAGGHDYFQLGSFTPNMIDKASPLVKGKSKYKDLNDCMVIKKY